MTSWQQQLNWLDDDEDQDSDTDSKLSGSAAADSVMRHLTRSRPPFKQGNEFSLGTMKEQDEEEAESVEAGVSSDELRSDPRASPAFNNLSNGYHQQQQQQHHHHHHHHQQQQQQHHQQYYPPHAPQLEPGNNRSPQFSRRADTSPQFQHRQSYENMQLPGYTNRKDILSPVPEGMFGPGGARVVEISAPPAVAQQYPPGGPGGPGGLGNPSKKWSFGSAGPGTHSMENISRGTPPNQRDRKSVV